MTVRTSLAEKIRRGDPISPLTACVLRAATPLFRFGMWRRLRQKRVRVDARTISFGNITAGGTGKTPAVIERARQEIDEGNRVAVLTRGYGTPSTKRPIASTEVPETDYVSELGDEPALILAQVPDAIVIKGTDRVASAQCAIRDHECNVLIMDDGFQYVRLERDEDIVLIDAVNPFGTGALLPRGILREPIAALTRATAIILTRCDQALNLSSLISKIQEFTPSIPIRCTSHAPECLIRLRDGQSLPLSTLRGRRVHALCGIGHPESFYRTLESLGAHLIARHTFPDHAPIPADAIPDSGIVVTTEKDAVRMENPEAHVLALRIALKDWEGDGSSTD